MERIRLLRVIARMNVGGPAIQVSGLMNGLPQDLFEQRLVTGFCDTNEVDFWEAQEQSFSAIRLPGLGRAIRPLDDVAVLGKMMGEIRRFNPHIVHTHTAKAGAIGRVAVKLSGSHAKVVHTYHGHLLHGYFSPTKTQAVTHAERALSRLSNRLVAVGEAVRDDLLAVGVGQREKYRVIQPGLRIGQIPPKDSARRMLGLPESGPILSFIGRVTEIKRPDRFLEVASRVVQQRPDAHFVVVGDGDQLPAMRSLAARANIPCHFLGMQAQIETCLAASDAVILTSDNEGTPISLIEAGMAGLPVVACDVGAVREVVIHGETGWLALPEADCLTDAVLELLRNSPEATRRGMNAKEFTWTKFGFSRFIEDYKQLYLELISDSRRT